jgi:hypothetical protein
MDKKVTLLQQAAHGEKAAKKYITKIVKFMLSNPQDLKRLAVIEGTSFSKFVKGKIDCDAAGVDIVLLQAQVARLEQEIGELKRSGVTPQIVRQEDDTRNSPDVSDWFED